MYINKYLKGRCKEDRAKRFFSDTQWQGQRKWTLTETQEACLNIRNALLCG